MYKFIDADYYGFRDEEDGVLLPVEAAAEKAMQAEVRGQKNACLTAMDDAKAVAEGGAALLASACTLWLPPPRMQ